MTPDAATTTSTPAPQATAPGTQAASTGSAPGPQTAAAPPAPQPTPVQLLWEVATLAFELMRRLVNVLQPIQQYYPKQALLLARLLIDIPRIFLTLRYAPERVTIAQLRHLTRARHILQALFNYALPLGPRTSPSATANLSPSASPENATPLGPRTSSSATATFNQHPSASPENATPLGARTPSSATTPSPAISTTPSPNAPSSATPGARKPSSATSATPAIRQVPEIPMVAGVAHVPASPTMERSPLTPDPSHISQPSPAPYNPQSAIRNPQSPFSPYIPDFHTLAQALKADSLPPNCAGALFEDPGDALVRALHQLHTIYFSLYPHQSPSPSPSQSQSPSNLQSTIRNLQSGHPQSAAPSVHPVNNVNPVNPVNSVHLVHSPSPSQSSASPHSAFPRAPS